MKFLPLLLCTLLPSSLFGDDAPKKPDEKKPEEKKPEEKKPEPISEKHFAVFDAKGNPSSLDALLERLPGVSVVFLGENHDDPVAHHLETLLLKKAHELAQRQAKPPGVPPRQIALAMEMFERDVQDILDEYLGGLINESNFKGASRPWKNYDKDYRPMVEYARENQLPVLASNAPRRYINRVGRLGAASLKDIPDAQRRGLPPLPYGEASPAYAAKFNDLMKSMRAPEKKDPPKEPVKDKPKEEEKKPATPTHDTGRGLEAQSLWDASMAYTIVEQLLRQPRSQVIHVNGGFHTENRMGIPEHLLRYRPGTSLLVVTMLSNKSFPKFDVATMADKGDFVIITDPAVARSYDSSPPPATTKSK